MTSESVFLYFVGRRTEMSKRDVAVFSALAGDLLVEFVCEPATKAVSMGDRSRAYLGWASVHLRRGVRLVDKRIRPKARPVAFSTAQEDR